MSLMDELADDFTRWCGPDIRPEAQEFADIIRKLPDEQFFRLVEMIRGEITEEKFVLGNIEDIKA